MYGCYLKDVTSHWPAQTDHMWWPTPPCHNLPLFLPFAHPKLRCKAMSSASCLQNTYFKVNFKQIDDSSLLWNYSVVLDFKPSLIFIINNFSSIVILILTNLFQNVSHIDGLQNKYKCHQFNLLFQNLSDIDDWQ